MILKNPVQIRGKCGANDVAIIGLKSLVIATLLTVCFVRYAAGAPSTGVLSLDRSGEILAFQRPQQVVLDRGRRGSTRWRVSGYVDAKGMRCINLELNGPSNIAGSTLECGDPIDKKELVYTTLSQSASEPTWRGRFRNTLLGMIVPASVVRLKLRLSRGTIWIRPRTLSSRRGPGLLLGAVGFVARDVAYLTCVRSAEGFSSAGVVVAKIPPNHCSDPS